MEENEKKTPRAKSEEKTLSFWKENKIFEKTLAKESPEGDFVFYEGPPTANGRPGIHHIESRAFKDIIPRYKTMRGFKVLRKAGWDTHGLPVELEVEKKLGLKSKKEIEDFGIEKFNEECRKNVWSYVDEWEKFTERIGYWVDLDNPYITYKPEYIETIWNIIKNTHNKNLLYKDYKVLPWCPRCGTALSSHELAQGYETVKDISLFVKFKLKETPDTYLLAWTTTPWTLPGNIALAVGEKIKYSKIKIENDFIWLAKDRLESVAPLSEVVEESLGKDLLGLEYEPLFPFVKENAPQSEKEKLSKSFKVYSADFVNTEDGSGIVHTAVMYGQDDFELGTLVGLPKFHLVDESGRFKENTGELSGKFVHDEETTISIIKNLAGRGLLFKKEKYEHPYPFCWRCKTRLVYYARASWYIKMSSLRDKLVSENQKINWEPEHIKNGRFGEWLSEVKDWAISRERYWGTPLPIWESANGEEFLTIGSVLDLKKYTKKSGNKYYMARHGEADHNISGKISFSDEKNIHLTENGKKEAEKIAKDLRGAKISKIFVSPFTRVKETADIIVKSLDLPKDSVLVDERIGELNPGVFDSKTWAERNAWVESQDSYSYRSAPEKGESHLDAKIRFADFLYEIESKYKNENILILTHGIGIEVLPAVAEGADETRSYEIYKNSSQKTGIVMELDFVPLPHSREYELDLHKPFIDEVVLEKDGKELRRIKEVLDVWFDSGSMPFAQNAQSPANSDKEMEERFKENSFPADFISEAIDQTRGWFYTLHAISILLNKGRAFKNVICLGHILDDKGQKMSKSKGNVVNPWEMVDKYGVDPLRFWMYSVNQPGDSKNFDERTVDEIVKKIFNLLDNVLSFYEMYSVPTDFRDRPKASNVLDQWILSMFDRLNKKMSEDLDSYKVFEASRSVRDFIADLSQWYLRRSRDRFKSDEESQRREASAVLGFILNETSKLLAPFAPFWAEEIYRRLGGEKSLESVHLETWPEIKKHDEKIISDMEEVRRLVSLSLEARASAGIKTRQPLSRLSIKTNLSKIDDSLLEIIKDEVNVKEISFDKDLKTDVHLDTTISEELKEEGEIREFIRAVQDARKKAGLKPNQKKNLNVAVSSLWKPILEKNKKMISDICGISEFIFGPDLEQNANPWFEVSIS